MQKKTDWRPGALQLLQPLAFPLLAIALGLLVGAAIIALSGSDPVAGTAQLLIGGFGNLHALTTTLNRATPIILAALSASLAWGSGYPSMGAGSQMVLGALASALVAAYMPGPPFLVLVSAILAGMTAGMGYSFIAAYLSHRFEMYLLIVTLMMNYIADNIATYLATYTFRDPEAVDRLAVQTKQITAAVLPRLFPRYTVHFGFVLALVAVVALHFLMKHTAFGYKAKMNGLNPKFALYGGVNSLRTMYTTLLLSGAVAGLGGAVETLGTRFRYVDRMITSPGYAWSGIIASLMASNDPIGSFISSVFLAGLTTGGGSVELKMHIPSEITAIIQGVITMFVTVRIAAAWRKKTAARGPAAVQPAKGATEEKSV